MINSFDCILINACIRRPILIKWFLNYVQHAMKFHISNTYTLKTIYLIFHFTLKFTIIFWGTYSYSKNIQISKDIGWVSQNTTLYYGVRCHRVDDMFRPFTIRPSSGLTWWKLKRKITMLHIAYIHSMLWLR